MLQHLRFGFRGMHATVRTKLRKEMRDRKATEHETSMHISKVGFERLVKDVLKAMLWLQHAL